MRLILLSIVVVTMLGPMCHGQGKSMLEGPYGKELSECKGIWDEISSDGPQVTRCMQAFSWAAGLKLAEPEGIPALGIGTLEPISVPEVEVINSPSIKGGFKNIRMYNVSKYLQPQYSKVTYDPETQIATSVTRAKEVHAKADYDFSADTGMFFGGGAGRGSPSVGGLLPITGKGEVVAYDSVNTLKLHMKKRKRGGLVISRVESNTVVGDLKIKAIPSNPNDPFAPMINQMLNIREVVAPMSEKFVMPIFNKQVAERVGKVFYNGWNKLEQL